jgi:hypothetical protein
VTACATFESDITGLVSEWRKLYNESGFARAALARCGFYHLAAPPAHIVVQTIATDTITAKTSDIHPNIVRSSWSHRLGTSRAR